MKTTKENKKPSRGKAKRQNRFFSLFRRKKKKKLKRNKFYWHRDGSKQGHHPAKIYKTNRRKNKYHAVCFTHRKRRGRTKLNKNINPKSRKECYVLNSPTVSGAGAFGNQIKGYGVKDRQDKKTIRKIQKKK